MVDITNYSPSCKVSPIFNSVEKFIGTDVIQNNTHIN